MNTVWMTGKKIMAGAICCSLLTTVNVMAEEKESKTINYEQAYELAIKNNSNLKSLISNMENTQENREDTFDGTVRFGTDDTFIIMDASRTMYLSAINSMDNSLKSSKLQQEITKVGVGASVKSYFAQIQGTEQNLNTAKQNFKIQRQLLIQANLKEDLGLISKNDLEEVKRQTTEMEQQIKHLELTLDNVYLALNHLLGFDAEDRYLIDNAVEFQPLNMDMSIDSYVTRSLSTDQSLKVQKLALDSAKFTMNTVVDSSTPADYREREHNYEDSERNYKDAKLAKEQSIRATYNDLKDLEVDHLNLEQKLEKAEENLATAKVNFEVGNITQVELDQAILGVESAKTELLKNTLSYDAKKYAFENTCILSNR